MKKKASYPIKTPVTIRVTPHTFDHLDKPKTHKAADGREIKLGR